MKKLATLFTLLVTVVVFGQTTSFTEVSALTKLDRSVPRDFTEYTSKDGKVFKIGDELTLGSGTKDGGGFVAVYWGDGLVRSKYPKDSGVGKKTVIRRMGIAGNKKDGFRLFIKTENPETGLSEYWVNLENALAAGEVK